AWFNIGVYRIFAKRGSPAVQGVGASSADCGKPEKALYFRLFQHVSRATPAPAPMAPELYRKPMKVAEISASRPSRAQKSMAGTARRSFSRQHEGAKRSAGVPLSALSNRYSSGRP